MSKNLGPDADAQVSIERERTWHTAEHEVLLAFIDDAGAQAFHEWWRAAGKHLWFAYYSAGGER